MTYFLRTFLCGGVTYEELVGSLVVGSSGLDKRANSRTLPALVREDMTVVSHIPDKWRAVTASPERNTAGTLSGTPGVATVCVSITTCHVNVTDSAAVGLANRS